MRKSNKYIYPFKIENFDKDDYKTLKDKFKQSFKFDNFVNQLEFKILVIY